MSEESNKVESLLFSSGRKMREDEIVQLTSLKLSQVKKGLEELQEKYGKEDISLMLDNEGDSWKLSVREKYLGIVQNIVTETELDKSIMETLAVIAWKYPILQADVIKIRNNKAYDHLRELEEAGFIAREVHGRTRSIKLTQKFFDYFDLPKGEQSRETFKKVVPEEIREAIERREGEIEETEGKIEEAKARKEEMEQKFREERKKAEKEVDLVDDFGAKTKLESYDEEPEEEKEQDRRIREIKEKLQPEVITEGKETNMRQEEREKKADEIAAKVETEEISPEVERRIEKLMHPEGYKLQKAEEPEEEEKEPEGEKEEEPKKEEQEPEEEPKKEGKEEFEEKNYTKEEQEHSAIENLSEGKPEDFEDSEKDQRAA